MAAVAAIRYIYGLDHDRSHMEAMGERQFLAATFVIATKYQLDDLESETYENMRKLVTTKKLCPGDAGLINDMLNAVTTTLAGTSRQDCRMRKLMVEYCFWNLPALHSNAARFSALLADNAELGFEMFTRLESTHNPFEGSWYCGGYWHPDVKPSCYNCEHSFPKQFILSHRDRTAWECPDCELQAAPHCWDENCPYSVNAAAAVKWVWEKE